VSARREHFSKPPFEFDRIAKAIRVSYCLHSWMQDASRRMQDATYTMQLATSYQ